MFLVKLRSSFVRYARSKGTEWGMRPLPIPRRVLIVIAAATVLEQIQKGEGADTTKFAEAIATKTTTGSTIVKNDSHEGHSSACCDSAAQLSSE